MINWKEGSDKIMAISATITAMVALVVALVEIRNEQEFKKLAVEPYIELANAGTVDYGAYAFLLINNGLGPAIIKGGSFTVDGAAMSSWSQAAEKVTGNTEPFAGSYSDVSLNRRVRAAETIEVFKITPYSELAKSFHQVMSTDRIRFDVCYCSIYGDCWRTTQKEKHESVKQCG